MSSSEDYSTITSTEFSMTEGGYRTDEIWGIMGLIIVFVPGIIAGTPLMVGLLWVSPSVDEEFGHILSVLFD